ncbi:MAG: CRISPR-associated endonuclease Cas1, partial [Patulibacter sp.]
LGRVRAAVSSDQLMGAEGWASRAQYAAFRALLAPEWGFAGRVRRPPTDPVNALISFAAVLLTQEVVAACMQAGLVPEVGVLHAPRPSRPNLALDLMEEFRPILVDGLALSIVRRRLLRPDDFTRDPRTGGVRMSGAAKVTFLREYERRMLSRFTHEPTGQQLSYRRGLAEQARQFARCCHDGTAAYVPVLLR